MKTCLDARLLRASACALALGLASQQASAEWLGLADGDYALSLKCFDGSLNCAYTASGQITVSGAGVSFMDVTMGGQHFVGDPTDNVQDNGTLHNYQASIVTNDPYSFLYVRYVTEVISDNTFGVGDRYWAFCVNASPSTCTLTAIGRLDVKALPAIPEPSTYLLMATGLAALGLWRRRQG